MPNGRSHIRGFLRYLQVQIGTVHSKTFEILMYLFFSFFNILILTHKHYYLHEDGAEFPALGLQSNLQYLPEIKDLVVYSPQIIIPQKNMTRATKCIGIKILWLPVSWGFFSDIFLFLNTFSGSIKIIQVIKLKSKCYKSLYVQKIETNQLNYFS